MSALSAVPITMIDGRETTFGEWDKQVKLVVNVASRCGLTPQYGALEELQKQYGPRGFTVIGFPSNQFLQELGSNDSVAEYCSTTWGVTFPMTTRVRVNGKKKHPLYELLRETKDAGGHDGRIRWNFEKFLVEPDGTIHRFAPTVTPDSPEIVDAIEQALAKLEN